MKYLVALLTLVSLPTITLAQTPQQVLKSEGYVLVDKTISNEVYYRPKEVKKRDGIVYYSTTTFSTAGLQKYSLESHYHALACREKKDILLGIHKVPYMGKASYQDLTKKGIKDSQIKSLTPLDKKMYSKLCK